MADDFALLCSGDPCVACLCSGGFLIIAELLPSKPCRSFVYSRVSICATTCTTGFVSHDRSCILTVPPLLYPEPNTVISLTLRGYMIEFPCSCSAMQSVFVIERHKALC